MKPAQVSFRSLGFRVAAMQAIVVKSDSSGLHSFKVAPRVTHAGERRSRDVSLFAIALAGFWPPTQAILGVLVFLLSP